MAFNDYVAELVGSTPHLPFPYAQILINRAWAEIRDIRIWSFLVQYLDLIAPVLVNTGTVACTQFSTTITFDATAIAALNASPSTPPIASPNIGVGRQFRIGSPSSLSTSAGSIYTLLTYNSGTGVATIDRPFTGGTGAGQTFMVYKAYYEPPVTDFVRYRAITNVGSGYAIIRDALNVPQESLAVFDPQRQSTGDAYYVSPFRTNYQDANSTVTAVCHELYPHPSNGGVYSALFLRRGSDLSNTVDLPNTFPRHVLMARAMMHACDWALKNVPVLPELQGTNWVLAKQSAEKMFRETIILAIKQDDQQLPQMPMLVGRYFSRFPMGGQWLQSHALPPGYMQP